MTLKSHLELQAAMATGGTIESRTDQSRQRMPANSLLGPLVRQPAKTLRLANWDWKALAVMRGRLRASPNA